MHRATLSKESTIALECVARANDQTHAWITYEAFDSSAFLRAAPIVAFDPFRHNN